MVEAGKTTNDVPMGQIGGEVGPAGVAERPAPSSGLRVLAKRLISYEPASLPTSALPSGDELATFGALAAWGDLSATIAMVESTRGSIVP